MAMRKRIESSSEEEEDEGSKKAGKVGLNTDLTEDDKKKFVSDAVFYILVQEQRRTLIRKGELMKSIGLTGRSKDLQDWTFRHAALKLHRVFGILVKEVAELKGYVLVNQLEDEAQAQHLSWHHKDKVQMGLLYTILAVIYMSNGRVVNQEVLFGFLQKLGVYEQDVGKKDRMTNNATDDDDMFDMFGDVKALIEKEWVAKQHYLHMKKVDTNDPENPSYEYRWGERAELELKGSDVMKFVSKIYQVHPKYFTQQFEMVREEEGVEVFENFVLPEEE